MIKSAKTSFIAILLFVFAGISLSAQEHVHSSFFEQEGRYREHSLDMTSLDLVVDLNPSKRRVNGQASYQFMPIQKEVDSAFFDAVDITIDHILLDDDTLQF